MTTVARPGFRLGVYVAPGHVRLVCSDPHFDETLLLGEDAPKVTGGFGGWEVTERPRSVGMTLWNGVEPYQLSLAVIFDGWTGQTSQEAKLQALIRAARGDGESPPGMFTVVGIPLPTLPLSAWVVEGLEFGDPITDLAANRLRQPVALTLREYVPPTYLARYPAHGKATTKTVVVRAKQGDTPAKIAKDRQCKWTELRDRNKGLINTANQKLKAGTKVRCPK